LGEEFLTPHGLCSSAWLVTLRIEQNLHVIFVFPNHHFKLIVYKFILSCVEFIILRVEGHYVVVGHVMSLVVNVPTLRQYLYVYTFSPSSILNVVVAGYPKRRT
jgi:hypothetical protein